MPCHLLGVGPLSGYSSKLVGFVKKRLRKNWEIPVNNRCREPGRYLRVSQLAGPSGSSSPYQYSISRLAIDAGELGVAPTSSIARRLIEYWYGEELPDGKAGWQTPGR